MQDDRRDALANAGLSLDPLISRLSRGDSVFGERLLPVAEGPVPIRGAGRATLALRESGDTVLVVTLPAMTARAAGDAADHLDRLAEVGERGLPDLTGQDVAAIRREYEKFFRRTAPAALNRDQYLIVVVDREPSADAWDTAVTEVGERLHGVYRTTGDGAELVRDPRSAGLGRLIHMPVLLWLGIIGLFVGAALAFYGVTRSRDETVQQPPQTRATASLGTVATGTPVGATLSRWIGQQRFARMSTGHLVFVYPVPGQLMVVRDQRDLGRAWRSPQAIDGIDTESISLAIDDRDRLHVVYANGRGASYALLTHRDSRWKVDAELEIDAAATGSVIDVAWDPTHEAVHTLWIKDTPDGEQPFWGAIDVSDEPEVTASEPLSDPGDATALGTIAAGESGRVVATYRKQTSPEGWFSRDVESSELGFSLGAEQTLPNAGGLVGAVSLEVDAEDTAHLVLRNDADFDLTYYRGRAGAGWTTGTVIVDGGTIDHVEHPSLSIDSTSGLLYLYVQTNAYLQEDPEIRLIVRDPASGWSGPFAITDAAQIPGGAIYPTTMGVVEGQPLVAWTLQGGGPAIQIARVVAP